MSMAKDARYRAALLAGALGFLGVVFGVGSRIGAGMPSIFWAFAVLPGVIGAANYIVIQRPRMQAQNEVLHVLFRSCGERTSIPSTYHPTFSYSLAASMLLTGVFSIAAMANPADSPGLVYAGYGAYLSTLWFMLVRLNANALSARFLVNSALKTSMAML